MIDEKKLIEALNDTEHSPACVIEIPNNAATQDIIDSILQAYRKLMFECINKQPKVDKWIPCSERMPKERESMFAKLKDTPNWNMSMFEKYSNEVNVTVEFTDGKRATKTMHTIDGKWVYQSNVIKRIVAWMPLPEPYKDGDSSENS